MDIAVRIVIGLVLLPFVYMLAFLIFTIATGVANLLALGLAKLLRGIFGIQGTWMSVASWSLAIGTLAKQLSSFLLGFGVFVFVVVPPGATVAQWLLNGAWIVALAIWMPSLFVGAMSARSEDFGAITASINGDRY